MSSLESIDDRCASILLSYTEITLGRNSKNTITTDAHNRSFLIGLLYQKYLIYDRKTIKGIWTINTCREAVRIAMMKESGMLI